MSVDTSPEAVEGVIQQLDWIGKAHIEATLRALLAERDAAYAAGQEAMRERAVKEATVRSYIAIVDNYTAGWVAATIALKQDIRALPILPRPE